MNIGIDIRCLATPHKTGVGQYTQGLLQSLFALDKKNNYYLFYNSFKNVSEYIPNFLQDNVHIVASRFPNKILHSSMVLFQRPRINNIMKKEFDLFFSPNLHFTSFSSNTKHVLTIHDLSFELFPEFFSKKRLLWHKMVRPKQQCQNAHHIIVPSAHTKHDLIDYFDIDSEKISVVQPGMSVQDIDTSDKSQCIQKYNLPEKFILFLGTVEPRKNMLGAIQAFEQSSLRSKGYELIIAGPKGWKCKHIIRRACVAPGIRYVGFVTEEEKQTLYSLASVFVFPSLYEGFGFPVLESMAAGTPVITSHLSSLPEVVGPAAYLVNPYNISEIIQGMELLASDKEVRQTYIEKGLDQAKKFNWNNAAADFFSLLTDVAQK